MGVKPVEYIKDSSTQGFAIAGDEKPINETTANTIQKDVDQGNTKDLDNAQDKYLSSLVDEDTIDYNPDEQKNVGRMQIKTKGEDGKDLSEKDGKGGAFGAASGAIAGAVGAATVAVIILCTTRVAKDAALKGSNVEGGMLAGGIIAAAGAAASLALSYENTFDPNLAERKNQTNNAEQNNQTIQSYYDTLSADMDEMVSDSERYKELLDGKTQSDIDMITELGALQAELNVYLSQGDTEKAAEIQAKIDEIKNGAKDDPAGAELADIKEGLETYAGHYNESIGVSESGDIVSTFLKDGNTMKKYAKAAQIASYIGVGVMLLGVAFATRRVIEDLSKIFTAPFAGLDAAGLTLCVIGGVMMSLAAVNFGKRAGDEGEAGDAGNQMAEYVASLNENIEAQGGFTEEVTAGYAEGDAQYAQVTQQTQEGVDKALQNQQQRLQNQPPENNSTGTPDNNPNPELEQEEPAA